MMAVADSDYYTPSFYEAQRDGSRSSARVMLKHVFDLLGHPPTSVVDVGCGVGTWLRAALDLGATHVRGFDGDWVQAAELEIPAGCFTSCDLTAMVTDGLPRQDGSLTRYDLVLSLEVAEHLPPPAGPNLVATLCGLGDMVVFSAAIPHQGGVNHINETWPGYWSALFREHGFECFDALRSAFWARSDVEWWYAQNALIFARDQTRLRDQLVPVPEPMPYVHPRKYLLQVAQTRELAAALAEAAAGPALTLSTPATGAAEIERLERKAVVLRALLEAKGGAMPDGLGSATLDALALYDRTRNQAFALAGEVAQLERETVELRARVTSLEAEAARARDEAHTLSADVARLREEPLGLRRRGAALESELVRAHAAADEARSALREIAGSTTWRATAPLRAAVETGKRLARAVRAY
jgi:SAM-dependent methyltransferase